MDTADRIRNCKEINFKESRRINSSRQGRENEIVAEPRRVFPDAVLANSDKRNLKFIFEQVLRQWMIGLGMACLVLLRFSGVEAEEASGEKSFGEFERAHLRLSCACASMAAYHNDLSRTMERMMTVGGWETERYYETSSVAQTKYAFFHATESELEKPLWILAIAGTENAKDAEVDLRLHRIPFGGHSMEEFKQTAEQGERSAEVPLVHQGFHDYSMVALFGNGTPGQGTKTFGESIAEDLKVHPEKKLYLTGHSLGGAVAVLAAARLTDLGVPPEQLEVITFGAPAVGNEAFAKTYEPRLQLERVVMKGDPVKSVLQSVSGGYVQFGTKVELRPLKGSWRFPHDMVLYLDGVVRNYYDAMKQSEQNGMDLSQVHRHARFSAKVYVPPLQMEMEEALQPVQPYIEMLMQDQLLDEFRNPVVSSEPANLKTLFQSARQTGCEYVLFRQLEAKKIRSSDGEFRITMGEVIFDARGNMVDAYSASTTTKHMTPLEAVAYVHENGVEMRERVFGR